MRVLQGGVEGAASGDERGIDRASEVVFRCDEGAADLDVPRVYRIVGVDAGGGARGCELQPVGGCDDDVEGGAGAEGGVFHG